MIISNSHHPQKYKQAQADPSDPRLKLDGRQTCFFFVLAPLSVLAGWSVVAICLTGDWAWEWPSGLLLAIIGSTVTFFGNVFRFR